MWTLLCKLNLPPPPKEEKPRYRLLQESFLFPEIIFNFFAVYLPDYSTDKRHYITIYENVIAENIK